MRNAAVMTVGTTLSRLTGFLRLAAMTATLGVTVSALGSVYTVANLTPEHPLRADPRRDPHVGLRPGLRGAHRDARRGATPARWPIA